MEEILALLMAADSNKKQQCKHLAFVNNSCADCKKPINKCDNPVTIPFRYIDRRLSLSVDGITHLRNLNSQNLVKRKKLHLVLDLDNTLIHGVKAEKNKSSSSSSKNDVHEILKGEVLVKVRPGAREFLEKVSQLFDLSIYSIADQPYARQIAKILESETVKFTRVISREDCTRMGRKGVDVVLFHPRMVLIVDDKVEVWGEDEANVIKIEAYTSSYFQKRSSSSSNETGDDEFDRVFAILKKVHAEFYDSKKQGNRNHAAAAAKDVRQLLPMAIMANSETY